MLPAVPYPIARPFLFGLDPERAHDLMLDAVARLRGGDPYSSSSVPGGGSRRAPAL